MMSAVPMPDVQSSCSQLWEISLFRPGLLTEDMLVVATLRCPGVEDLLAPGLQVGSTGLVFGNVHRRINTASCRHCYRLGVPDHRLLYCRLWRGRLDESLPCAHNDQSGDVTCAV